MNFDDLYGLLIESCTLLFEKQPNIFDFSVATNQTEWNLAHHLANEIHLLLPGLDHDIDVVKLDYGNKRPDIIFHRRGTDEENFLIVEVKYDRSQKDIDADIHKIHQTWFQYPLHYEFGSVIHLKSDKTFEINLFKNDVV